MEPFDIIFDEFTSFYSGEPGSDRWENITACLGWTAALFLTVGFLATVTGFDRFALSGLSAFPFFLWRALARDWKKIKHNSQKRLARIEDSFFKRL